MAPEEDSENGPGTGSHGPPAESPAGDRGDPEDAGPTRAASRPGDGSESPTLGRADGEAGERIAGPLLEVGGTWGHLEILRKLGEGEFGEVYQCRDPSLDLIVALKLIRRRFETEHPRPSGALRTFLREGRFLARVRHPNVVTVHGAAMHDRLAGIWMEYVRGRTLTELLKRQGLFGPREASLVGADLCRALAAVHAEGVIHRDIKAQNVIREDGGRIVLMDFGAGRDLVERNEERLRLAGTPLYMAPETLLEGIATQRTDLYGLGVLLFHLVTGTFPITGSTLDEIVEACERRRGTPLRDLRPDLPTGFVRAVERSIAFDPGERFASAGEMERALESHGETSISWDAPPRPERQGPSMGETPTGTWILRGLAGLALAIFLGTVTSVAYRVSLGIPEGFQPEGLLEDVSIWGVRTFIPTLVIMLLMLGGLGAMVFAVRAVWWGIRALAPPETAARWRRRFMGLHLRLTTLDAGTVSKAVFLAGLVAVSGLVYVHSGLLGAVIDLMSEATARDARVSLLDPATQRPRHYGYFIGFTAVILALIGGLWGISTLAGENGPERPLDRAARAGIIVLALVAATVMVLPWRLLFHAEGEPACYDGRRAFIIGERDEDLLLYFPGTRRTRRVQDDTEFLERERERRTEYIFDSRVGGCATGTPP